MKSTVEQSKTYRSAFIAIVIAAILTYFILRLFGPLVTQYSFYNSWISIKSPPSGAARIIGVTGGREIQEVLIEAHNGQIFSASVCGDASQTCDPPAWKSISKAPTDFIPITRATDCETLGEFPLKPTGHLVECIYYTFMITTDDIKNESYVALLTDGSLKYFAMDNWSSLIRVIREFILITPLLYFTILFLVFRLVSYVAKQIQARSVR
jgi:hypothetical protein